MTEAIAYCWRRTNDGHWVEDVAVDESRWYWALFRPALVSNLYLDRARYVGHLPDSRTLWEFEHESDIEDVYELFVMDGEPDDVIDRVQVMNERVESDLRERGL